MVVLRTTRNVLASLPEGPAEIAESGTARGDWFVTRVVVDRRPLLFGTEPWVQSQG